MFLDLVRGTQNKKIFLSGIDRVWVCTNTENSNILKLRHYKINFKKSGTKVPLVELSPVGPFVDFQLEKELVPDHDLWKNAIKIPKFINATQRTEEETPEAKKARLDRKKRQSKNISKDELGNITGRIHVGRQNFDQIYTPLSRAFKIKKSVVGKAEDRANEWETSEEDDGATRVVISVLF